MQNRENGHPLVITCILDSSKKLIYSNTNEEYALRLLKDLDLVKISPSTELIKGEWFISIESVHLCCKTYELIVLQQWKSRYSFYEEAFLDKATMLYNRNLWEKITTNKMLIKFRRYGLIILDIDNLKAINDKFGHLVGDQAIKNVADAIMESIREIDLAFRYGGDEFLIILPEIDNKKLDETILEIRRQIEEKEKQLPFILEVSIGSICTEGVKKEVKELFKEADQAMYQEKNKKEGRIKKDPHK